MAALEPTYGNFSCKGFVTGLSGGKAFTNGEKGRNEWNRLSFGVKVGEFSFVYVELMGTKPQTVKYCRFDSRKKRYDLSECIEVNYEDTYRLTNEGYKMFMPVRIDVNHQEIELTQYDAAKYLNDNLSDGEVVLITGSIQITKYNGMVQEKFIIKNIYSSSDIDLSEPQAYFEQEFVFMGIDDESIKGNIIYKQNGNFEFVPYRFTITTNPETSKQILDKFRTDIPNGSTLKVYGDIVHGVEVVTLDDGSKCVAGSPKKELRVAGGNLTSLRNSKYSEQDFISIMDNFVFEEETESEDILGF